MSDSSLASLIFDFWKKAGHQHTCHQRQTYCFLSDLYKPFKLPFWIFDHSPYTLLPHPPQTQCLLLWYCCWRRMHPACSFVFPWWEIYASAPARTNYAVRFCYVICKTCTIIRQIQCSRMQGKHFFFFCFVRAKSICYWLLLITPSKHAMTERKKKVCFIPLRVKGLLLSSSLLFRRVSLYEKHETWNILATGRFKPGKMLNNLQNSTECAPSVKAST